MRHIAGDIVKSIWLSLRKVFPTSNQLHKTINGLGVEYKDLKI
jgi:hypothetical protein